MRKRVLGLTVAAAFAAGFFVTAPAQAADYRLPPQPAYHQPVYYPVPAVEPFCGCPTVRRGLFTSYAYPAYPYYAPQPYPAYGPAVGVGIGVGPVGVGVRYRAY